MSKPDHTNLDALKPPDYFWLDSQKQSGCVLHVYRDAENRLWAIHEYVSVVQGSTASRFGDWFRVRSHTVTVYDKAE